MFWSVKLVRGTENKYQVVNNRGAAYGTKVFHTVEGAQRLADRLNGR